MLEQFTLHPPQRVLEVIETHAPLQHADPLPHDVPFATVREHARDSPLFTLVHAPPAQRRWVRVRLWVPVVSHALL